MEKKTLIRAVIGIAVTVFFVNILPVLADDVEDAVLKPRVSQERLASVRSMKNPVAADSQSIARGKEIFYGKGLCYNCHGDKGKGDGPGGASFDPGPRNFTDTAWQKARTDGEIFTAITEGTQYGMIPFGDNLTEKERWDLVNFLRTFGGVAVVKK